MGSGRIGISKAHSTPWDVHDVYSRGEIRDLDGRPGPVSGSQPTDHDPPLREMFLDGAHQLIEALDLLVDDARAPTHPDHETAAARSRTLAARVDHPQSAVDLIPADEASAALDAPEPDPLDGQVDRPEVPVVEPLPEQRDASERSEWNQQGQQFRHGRRVIGRCDGVDKDCSGAEPHA